MLAELFLKTVFFLAVLATLCLCLCWSRRSVPRSKRLDKRRRNSARSHTIHNDMNERSDTHEQ